MKTQKTILNALALLTVFAVVSPVVAEGEVKTQGWFATLKTKLSDAYAACTWDNTKALASTLGEYANVVYSYPASVVNAGLVKAGLDLAKVEFFKNHTTTASIASHAAKVGSWAAVAGLGYGAYRGAKALVNKFAGKSANLVEEKVEKKETPKVTPKVAPKAEAKKPEVKPAQQPAQVQQPKVEAPVVDKQAIFNKINAKYQAAKGNRAALTQEEINFVRENGFILSC